MAKCKEIEEVDPTLALIPGIRAQYKTIMGSPSGLIKINVHCVGPWKGGSKWGVTSWVKKGDFGAGVGQCYLLWTNKKHEIEEITDYNQKVVWTKARKFLNSGLTATLP